MDLLKMKKAVTDLRSAGGTMFVTPISEVAELIELAERQEKELAGARFAADQHLNTVNVQAAVIAGAPGCAGLAIKDSVLPVPDAVDLPPLPEQPEALSAYWTCEDCDGHGVVGELQSMGHFQPPEASTCGACDGAGRIKVPAFTDDQMQAYARAALAQAKDAPSEPVSAPEAFACYVRANYNGVVDIHRPEWHAARLWRAAMHALAQAAPASPASEQLRAWLSSLEDEALTDTGPQMFTKVRTYLQGCGYLASPASAPVAPEPNAPHILEALSYHERERDDLTLEDAVEAFRNGYKKVAQRDDRAMLAQIIHLLASTPVPAELVGEPDLLTWAVERWHAEVSNRPLVNVHRRSLDDTWRQVIKHCGGDPVALCGPSHDDMLAAAPLPPVVARKVLDEALLTDVRQYIERTSEESGYGYSRPANPHDFHPDAECCSEEEIAAHKAACEAFDKGEYTPERGSEWVGNMHILRAPWGIGSYTYRDGDAVALLARIDAARLPGTNGSGVGE